MRVLHQHNILPLYVWVDDALAPATQTEKEVKKRGGHPTTLRDSEVVYFPDPEQPLRVTVKIPGRRTLLEIIRGRRAEPLQVLSFNVIRRTGSFENATPSQASTKS